MRFKVYYMVCWVKEMLEQNKGETTPVPEHIQLAMEEVLDFISALYEKSKRAAGEQAGAAKL